MHTYFKRKECVCERERERESKKKKKREHEVSKFDASARFRDSYYFCNHFVLEHSRNVRGTSAKRFVLSLALAPSDSIDA